MTEETRWRHHWRSTSNWHSWENPYCCITLCLGFNYPENSCSCTAGQHIIKTNALQAGRCGSIPSCVAACVNISSSDLRFEGRRRVAQHSAEENNNKTLCVTYYIDQWSQWPQHAELIYHQVWMQSSRNMLVRALYCIITLMWMIKPQMSVCVWFDWITAVLYNTWILSSPWMMLSIIPISDPCA